MGYKEILLQKKQAEADNNALEKPILSKAENVREISENSRFFGVESINSFLYAVDLRLKNGKLKGLEYSHVIDWDYDLSEGIIITTSLRRIVIEGRNLQMLYTHLLSHRVKYIQANIGNDLCGDKDLFVKDIRIEEL